jgi:hypothetical protein
MFRPFALLVAGSLAVMTPLHAQSLAEASAAAVKVTHEWPLSMNPGPAPAAPATAAEVSSLQGTFADVYAAGKVLESASTTGALAQVRDHLIAFQAALAIVADHKAPSSAETALLAQYQAAAQRFTAGTDNWEWAIRNRMPTLLAGVDFAKGSAALDVANRVYLGKAPKL